MTAPLTTPTSRLDAVAAAWLAGGLPRALDTVLVSRLERRRIRVVDGDLVDRGLDRAEPLDAALLDALGARGRKDTETVRWRLSRDRRLDRVRVELLQAGLLGQRTPWGLPDRPERPARTASGRRVLRELRDSPHPGAAWEVALHGRAGLTDLALRESLEPPVRPAPTLPPPRGRLFRRTSLEDRHLYAGGASSATAIGGWGGFGGAGCGGFDGGGGGGDGGC
jgi:hypothetical protein